MDFLHSHRIVQHGTFCAWLFFLNILYCFGDSSILLYVFSALLHFFFAKMCYHIYCSSPFVMYSAVDIHLDCFYFWVIWIVLYECSCANICLSTCFPFIWMYTQKLYFGHITFDFILETIKLFSEATTYQCNLVRNVEFSSFSQFSWKHVPFSLIIVIQLIMKIYLIVIFYLFSLFPNLFYKQMKICFNFDHFPIVLFVYLGVSPTGAQGILFALHWRSLLAEFTEPYVTAVAPMSTTCKANTIPSVLTFWATFWQFVLK